MFMVKSSSSESCVIDSHFHNPQDCFAGPPLQLNDQAVMIVQANRVLSAGSGPVRAEHQASHCGQIAFVTRGPQELKATPIQAHYGCGQTVGITRIDFESIVNLVLKYELHAAENIVIVAPESPSLHLV
jgi:hypothetical protein